MTRVGQRNRRMLFRDFQMQDGASIGAFVWWDLVEVAVRRGTLEGFLREADLDPDLFLPVAQKAETHFHKAAQRFEVARREHSSSIVYCVDNEAFVIFDRATEKVSIEGTSSAASGIVSLWREYVAGQIVTTTDWRRKLEEIFMQLLGGCRIRSSGPPYFVPAPFMPEVLALRSVTARLQDHAHKAALYQVPVDEPGDLTRKARDMLEAELQVLAAQVDEIRTATRRTHAATLERRLVEFEALQSKIELYSTLLKFEAADLKQAGEKLEHAVRELLERR